MSGPIATAQIESPLGPVSLTANDQHLLGIRIGRKNSIGAEGHPLLKETQLQLIHWFAGKMEQFDLPLAPLASEEGERLRAAIAAIPYGETMTYGALGKKYGSVARAVGQACKTNPFPIIIPCHRVVSTNGPEFYSGGDGPHTKGWLLDFEASNIPPDRRTRLL